MAFLAVSEHPPAVHNGAVLPPTMLQVPNTSFQDQSIIALSLASAQMRFLQGAAPATAYGEAVLLRRPLADASMPYNALCLTLSVAVLHVAALAGALLQ